MRAHVAQGAPSARTVSGGKRSSALAPEAVGGGGAPERAAEARGAADVVRRAEGEDVGEWPWAEIG
jgi:hypothetical protein